MTGEAASEMLFFLNTHPLNPSFSSGHLCFLTTSTAGKIPMSAQYSEMPTLYNITSYKGTPTWKHTLVTFQKKEKIKVQNSTAVSPVRKLVKTQYLQKHLQKCLYLGQFPKRRIFVDEVWRWKNNLIHSDDTLSRIWPIVRIQYFSFGHKY